MKKVLVIVIMAAIMFSCLNFYGCSSEFTLALESSEMNMYEEQTLVAKVGNKRIDGSEITWSSSDNQVATVDDGKVTALKLGNIVVTAIYGEDSKSCEIVVTRNKVGRILSISSGLVELEVGNSQKIVATFKESGTVIDVPILWESINPLIATVTSDGTIRAESRGTAIVSAFVRYKGQNFYKDIVTKALVLKKTTKQLDLQDTAGAESAGTTLANYTGDALELGFASGQEIKKYDAKGGSDSRIFPNNTVIDGQSEYNMMIFDVKFATAPNEIVLNLGGNVSILQIGANIGNTTNSLLMYGSDGKMSTKFDMSHVYTIVVDLDDIGNSNIIGVYFGSNTVAYIGSANICSTDEYLSNYNHQTPKPIPKLGFVRAETNAALALGETTVAGFDKHWVLYSTGTPAPWHDKVWNERVVVSGVAVSKYRDYEYFGFDIMLSSIDFTDIALFNGEQAMFVSNAGVYKGQRVDVAAGDIVITTPSDGTIVAEGTPFAINTIYRLKIKIYKTDEQNMAFGVSFNSPTSDIVYLANPVFSQV